MGGRVLDIACGKAEGLIQIATRYTISGVGVPGAGRCQLHAPDSSFDLVICLGASWVFGGYHGTVRRLGSLARSGGQVMVGEPFWIREPELDYLHATDTPREIYGTHAGNAAAGEPEGLSLLYTLVSSPADWDRYAGRRWVLQSGMQRFIGMTLMRRGFLAGPAAGEIRTCSGGGTAWVGRSTSSVRRRGKLTDRAGGGPCRTMLSSSQVPITE